MLTQFTTRAPFPPSSPTRLRPTTCVLTPSAPSHTHRSGHAAEVHIPAYPTPALHRLPLPTSFLDGRSDESGISTSTESERTNGCVRRLTLTGEHVGCIVTAAGEFFLVRQNTKASAKERIACQGSVTLPRGASEDTFSVGRQRFENGRVVEAEITWGPPSQPLARLMIYSPSPAAAKFDWCKVRF